MNDLKIGTDIISIKRFRRRFEKVRAKFERDVFWGEEYAGNSSAEHLAGIFAAKEAAMKALGLCPGAWKDIKITKDSSDRPRLILMGNKTHAVKYADLSISHDGNYAIAVVVIVMK